MCLLETNKSFFSKSKVTLLLVLVCALLFWLFKTPEKKPVDIEPDAMTDEAAKQEPAPASSDVSPAKPPTVAEPSVASGTAPAHALTADELDKVMQLRSQVKMALASGYTSMISFRAEYNRYSTDFRSIGFGPLGGSISYKIGFLAPYIPAGEEPTVVSENSNNMTSDFIEGQKYDPVSEKINLADFARHCERGCTANDSEFELIAVLPIPNSANADVWLINEKKEIKQVIDGLR